MSDKSLVSSVTGPLRLGARTVGFVAYALGSFVHHEIVSAPIGTPLDDERVRVTMRRFGRDTSRLFGVDLVTENVPEVGYVRGCDDGGMGRLFVCNHRSGLDVLVTLATLEGRHVSRADLAKWPVIGLVARRAGVLFVDRENRRSAAAVMQSMIDQVSRGKGVVVFAEGTTFSGDEVREFKPGAFTVARRTGCEIIPVGLAYAGSASNFEEDEDFVQHMKRVGASPRTRVAMVVGSPMRAEGRDSRELSIASQAAVQALVHRARAIV